jgi:hypothetical protein
MLEDGSMSLEPDDTGTAQPPKPAPAPPVEPVAAAPLADAQSAPDDDAEPGPSDVQTMVPLASLKEARAHMKTLKAQIAELEPLRGKAAESDRMIETVQRWKPIIEAIQARPDLIEQARRAPAPDPVEASISEQEALEYARDIQLYDAAGQLDVKTARRALARQNRVAMTAATQAAQAVVAPLQRQNSTREADSLLQRAAAVKDKHGRSVDAKVLQQFWSVLPPDVASNPEVASVLYFAAKGYAAHNGLDDPPPPPPPPVVPTEAPGGRMPTLGTLNDLDRRMARDLGRKPAEYSAIAARFKPGQMNVLED